jgi:succinylglutamic semialdehyde dehydrogenase
MNYIDGNWIKGTGAAFQSENPATGEVIWQGNAASGDQVAQAVEAARTAQAGWVALSYDARLKHLQNFADAASTVKADLAEMIAKETGKVLWDAAGEAAAVCGKLGFATAAYAERTGAVNKDIKGGKTVIRHAPHGVFAVFSPYNFPAHLANGHMIPALLAGNTVVLKPSELTPATAEWMIKLWEKSGLPKGVINLVQGEAETGIALSHTAIDGVLFTGSTATGTLLHKQFGGRPEIVLALEMGGNNPLIIDEVADLDAAVNETILSAFITSGQRCTCARRLILTDKIQKTDFVERLIAKSKSLRVGAYNDQPEPFMGPLVANKEASRILQAQADLQQAGGEILLESKRLKADMPFLSPSIIDVTSVKNRQDNEFFGPLLQIIRVNDMKQAVKEANNTKYGLSAAIFCDDRAVYDAYAPQIKAGLVNWNKQTTGASGSAPFGGAGCSGNHRPAGYYSADYCAYPVSSVEIDALHMPEKLSPGMA